MSDDLVKRLRQPWDADRSIMSQTGRWMVERKEAADRIEELEIENRQLRGLLCRLVFCEDAEFYPSAIESASPYCIDFEQWHEDAIKLLTGGKDDG